MRTGGSIFVFVLFVFWFFCFCLFILCLLLFLNRFQWRNNVPGTKNKGALSCKAIRCFLPRLYAKKLLVFSPSRSRALITGQLRIFRNVIKLFCLVSWSYYDYKLETLRLCDPNSSKMSAAPFTVEMIFVFLVTLCLLHQYGNWRKQHWLVTIAVFIAWYFSFLIVFILPLDVSAVSWNHFRCLGQLLLLSEPTCSVFIAKCNIEFKICWFHVDFIHKF